MRQGITLVAIAFAVTLAIVVGNRMSADAMAVVVGVVCGVVASVPTSLLLIWALGRRTDAGGTHTESKASSGIGMHYPPVVVVNPGPGYGAPGYGTSPAYPPDRNLPPPAAPRVFKVVGDEETDLDVPANRLLGW